MPPAPIAESGTHGVYRKSVGDEPLPGYKLLAPLGRGGFGEVWKCEAPGGLHKAIKFVTTDSEDGCGQQRYAQEFGAFEQIKAIRHPFLLTLERVEQIGHDLIMVMELADRHLASRFRECRACGLPGIPRDELLAYCADAAEALDMMATKYNLQHLDIKPANLFLVSGHVKVGDYGLVSNLQQSSRADRGLTPRYVAPEVLHGTPSHCSDQYSLALVYYELLTGEFPYSGKTPQQLMLQHVSAMPDLTALPPADRAAVARALAKRPDERFPSCLAFVQTLMIAGADTTLPHVGLTIRRAQVDRAVAERNLVSGPDLERNTAPTMFGSTQVPNPTPDMTVSGRPSLTFPVAARLSTSSMSPTGAQPSAKPALRAPMASPLYQTPGPASLVITPAPLAFVPQRLTPPKESELPVADEIDSGMVVLDRIRSVVRAEKLVGRPSGGSVLDPQTFSDAVVQAAAHGAHVPKLPGDIGRLPDGTWLCRFPSTVPLSVIPLKLAVLCDVWGVAVEQPEPTLFVLRRTVGGGLFGRKKFGYELLVQLPAPAYAVGEIVVRSRLFGTGDQKFVCETLDILPKVIGDVRSALANVEDRRKHPRVACDLPVVFYPLHSDGSVDTPVAGRCHNVSTGGLAFVAPGKLPTKYHYVVFADIAAVANQAALVRVMWTKAKTDGTWVTGCQYRTDL